ncbi:MAG: tetratricopeptide repeat protein [Alistipes sp.]|nr:tetratricopeptide repeat protein [Alistipes sp.]
MKRVILYIATLFTLLLCGTNEARAQYNKDYYFWMGRSLMMNNDYQEAIRTLNTLLRFDDDVYEAYFLRGIAKHNLDDLLGAESDFSIAIEKNPVYTNAYTYRAITRLQLGNYDDALNDFREAIDLRPDRPSPYYYRGVTRLMNQQFDDAISDFNTFILYEKKVAEAYINRGLCYLHLKDTTRAYDNFDTAIRTNRENPDGYNRRGELFMRQQRYAEAEADFDKAVGCDSTYIVSFFNRALVYSDTNRPMQALGDFDRVLQIDSTNAITYFNRGIVRAQIGDYHRSLDDFDKLAGYAPNNVLVFYNRANIHAQLGNAEQAVDDYTRAIELYPDFANAYINRSYMRAAMNDMRGARSDRNIADRKIAAYKARLERDSTYSIYADTTQKFDRLLSFDSKFAGTSRLDRLAASQSGEQGLALLPMFKFTVMRADTAAVLPQTHTYRTQRDEDFRRRIGNPLLTVAAGPSNIEADSLLSLDRALSERIKAGDQEWTTLFERGITQSLIKQYTSAVTSYTAAIDAYPANPFLYMNRATTRAEMIDFISSIDNSYQRISIDTDPANRLENNRTRSYDYEEAIADMNKALKLYADYAYFWYNRANLQALSGRLPEAFADYSRAIELNPSFAEAYYNRGLTQIFMKDTRKGCLDISKAGELGIEHAYELLKEYSKMQ